ncbi:hypothetical protein B0J11DRAFT_446297, partial [Dendryphion nanum]
IKALLEALALFLFKSTSNKLFSSKLIYFLAVLRINTKINYLHKAKHYLYILASIVYYIKVLSIEKLLLVA